MWTAQKYECKLQLQSAPAIDVTMSSRYAQLYSQQAYLSQLLHRSGYGGELPPFLSAPSAPGADHPLLAWMASALGDEHFMSEASVSEAQQAESDAMQQKLSLDAAAAAADVLLQGFEEADDLLPLHDQKQPHSDMDTLHVGLPGTATDQASLATVLCLHVHVRAACRTSKATAQS